MVHAGGHGSGQAQGRLGWKLGAGACALVEAAEACVFKERRGCVFNGGGDGSVDRLP
jgi:hypothetical protein